jgi:hypothetical protein
MKHWLRPDRSRPGRRSAPVVLALLTLATAPALAEPVPVSGPAAAAPRAPEPALPRTHGGFYLGVQSGPAYFRATSEWRDAQTNSDESREFSGPSLALWVSIGGVAAKRIALAFSLGLEPVLSLSGTDETGSEMELDDVDFTLRTESFLLDCYPSPQGGFHVLGALGLAQLLVSRPGEDDADDPSGTFWALGAGYDWWVSDDASVGLLGRVSNASLESQETGTDADLDIFSFGLHLTATVN